MFITFPSLCMCLFLGPKRPKYNYFLSKNISYNISNQRRRQNVSSSVRNFTGSCPNSRDQGRIMLHYLEGYPSNLRKLIIFKKIKQFRLFSLYDTQACKFVPLGNQANKLTTIERHPFTFNCRSARIELKHLSSITHFPPDSVYLLGQLSKEDANSSTLD